jgi:hypothetical protein
VGPGATETGVDGGRQNLRSVGNLITGRPADQVTEMSRETRVEWGKATVLWGVVE